MSMTVALTRLDNKDQGQGLTMYPGAFDVCTTLSNNRVFVESTHNYIGDDDARYSFVAGADVTMPGLTG